MMISARGSCHQNNEFTNAMCTTSDNSGKKRLLLADRSSFNALVRTKKEPILRALVSLNPQIPTIYSRLVKMINSYLFNPQSPESLHSEATLSLKTFVEIFNAWIQINHRGPPRSPPAPLTSPMPDSAFDHRGWPPLSLNVDFVEGSLDEFWGYEAANSLGRPTSPGPEVDQIATLEILSPSEQLTFDHNIGGELLLNGLQTENERPEAMASWRDKDSGNEFLRTR
jgi:hypothetical protein